jgi:uncharacterized iron-regulated membrane protein
VKAFSKLSIHKKLALVVFACMVALAMTGMATVIYHRIHELQQEYSEDLTSYFGVLRTDFVEILSLGSPVDALSCMTERRNRSICIDVNFHLSPVTKLLAPICKRPKPE